MPVPIPLAPSRLAAFHGQLPWPLTPSRLPLSLDDTWAWADADDHYDRARGLRLYRDHARANGLSVATDPSVSWDRVIAAAFRRYGLRYVIPSGGAKMYTSFARGAAMHHLETKDPDALQVVKLLQPGVKLTDLPLWYTTTGAARETAFMLDNALAGLMVGLPESPAIDILAGLSLGHLARWSRPAGSRWGFACKPFMMGLACLSLIQYRERFRAAKLADIPAVRAAQVGMIPLALANALDWLWATCWIPTHADWSHGCFKYQDVDGTKGRPSYEGLTVVGADAPGTFRGPDSLPTTDGFFDDAEVEFSGPKLTGKFPIATYTGKTREFRLHPYYAPLAAPGDKFVVRAGVETDAGDGPAPDLNHLIAPAFAYLYRETGEAKWRERYDAIFDGGSMSWVPPYAQKQWNETMFASTWGLGWRKEGVAKEEGTPPPVEPPPVDPPRPRRFLLPVPEAMTVELKFLMPVDGPTKLDLLYQGLPEGTPKPTARRLPDPAPPPKES